MKRGSIELLVIAGFVGFAVCFLCVILFDHGKKADCEASGDRWYQGACFDKSVLSDLKKQVGQR